MQHDKFKLLERYHDGEVTPEESARVEELLEHDIEALEYLGTLDEMADLARTAVDAHVMNVSFEGMWDKVQTQIESIDAEKTRTAAPTPEPGVLERATRWLQEMLSEHKSAWITAGATACAVALVLVVFGDNLTQAPNTPGLPSTPGAQLTKHSVLPSGQQIIVVESVDKIDPNSTVLINHVKNGNTAVIWTLPPQGMPQDDSLANPNQEDEEEGIEIVEEPL